MTFTAVVLTLHPEMFPGPLGVSLAGRALAEGRWRLETMALRQFGVGRHRAVDDTPAGGGPGMVMRVDVMARAIDAARAAHPELPVWIPTPRAPRLDQRRVRALAQGPGVILLCPRFEGLDERIFAVRPVERFALADVVLSGGELPAMALLDACVRLLPGVMGAPASGAEESFERGLLEYPQFTRPLEFEGHAIPEVLRSGNHAAIAAWRRARAEADTEAWRPDLMAGTGGSRGRAQGERR
ncbi:MAG: tRNA (guanosine(37)-N1)-methyltransferase TrmD [Sphingomonadaceae bacterium]|uniref:tRNA (guanosine(37)-N1)-methyltransferase TrmD n=1 Tax=Thermaurantiacus sp. TaxID=2820283 RepID=UPI00298F3341|nr:tRNA (guanosine(37)-N1)-methyltransferase TrmD [Thermaurantiacus sp.]MCS6986207.1 tRNA (guanosine(37)-N1)-methyltransferase TrmD [Sphingomonadaceae bacterium]MDW8415864.1 tRNA (guanosine(37)-N1)-methyltransferase TrmD [Thermaurantiacus sp.]